MNMYLEDDKMELLKLNKLTSQSERLKFARKYVHLSQKELAEGLCTESNISRYEHGQTIPLESAVLMIDKINKKAEELRLNVYIDTAWLYKSIEDQVNDILNSKIKALNKDKNNRSKIKALESFLEEYKQYCDIELYMEAYIKINNFYYSIKQYKIALDFIERGLQIAINMGNADFRCRFLFARARIEIKEDMFQSAEQILKAIECLDIENKYKERCDLYKVSIYKETKNYKNGIKLLAHKIESLNLSELLFLGNCYMLDESFEDSERVYKLAINKAISEDDIDSLCIAYRNLSEVYFKKGDKKEAKYYIRERLKIDNSHHIEEHLTYASTLYIGTDNNRALKMLYKAERLIKTKNIDDAELLSEIYSNIAKIYISNNEYRNLKELLRKGEIRIIVTKEVPS